MRSSLPVFKASDNVREDGSFDNREVVWIDEIEHCLEEMLGEGFAGRGPRDEEARDLL